MIFFKKFPSPIVLCWYIVKKLTFVSSRSFCHPTVVDFLVFPSYTIISSSLVAQRVKCLPTMGETGFNPGLGRSSGEGNGNPLQYSCLEIPMDRGAWWAYSPWGHKESEMAEQLHSLTHL